jgi:hypothetical protein
MNTIEKSWLAMRAEMPAAPKTWADIGMSERPLERIVVPYGKPARKGGWHRDRITGKKLK